MQLRRVSIGVFVVSAALCAQTAGTVAAPSPVGIENAVLPPYVAGGVTCSQFTKCAGFISGIFPETSKVGGLYGAVTADLQLVKVAVDGKQGFALSPTWKFGEHKVVFNDISATRDSAGNVTAMSGNMLLVGVDAGAAFSSSTATSNTGGLSINLAGSFTVTYLRQLNPHLAIAFPVQLNYVSGVGANGSGAWAPAAKVALVWTIKP